MSETAPHRANRAVVLTEAAVIYAIGEGVVVVDGDGGLLVLNPAADRLLGSGLRRLFNDDRTGSWTMTLEDGTEAESGDLPLAGALRGETPDDVQVVLHEQGLSPRLLNLSARAIRGPALGGAVLTMRDVTERRRSTRKHATLPAAPAIKRGQRVEHEYGRKAALCYLAAWDAKHAKLFDRCPPPRTGSPHSTNSSICS